jgi:hypothetical protein
MSSNQPLQSSEEAKITITCENCGQKLRIPLRRKSLHVACPKCRHEFTYEFVEGIPVTDASQRNTPQQICQIVEKTRETFSKNFMRWEAHKVSPQGATIIARSNEYTHPTQEKGCLGVLVGIVGEMFGMSSIDKESEIFKERRRAANAQVVAQLLTQGWEVASVNSDGLITMLRRTN